VWIYSSHSYLEVGLGVDLFLPLISGGGGGCGSIPPTHIWRWEVGVDLFLPLISGGGVGCGSIPPTDIWRWGGGWVNYSLCCVFVGGWGG
jgi:hypothetical protein